MNQLVKLEQFEGKFAKSIGAIVHSLTQEIIAEIQSKSYRRDVQLPAIIGVRQPYETDAPNLSNPTMDDIAKTVHIISLLHSRNMYMDHRAESGIYEADYNLRIKLLHAMSCEKDILEMQINCIKGERAMQDQSAENRVPSGAQVEHLRTKAIRAN